MVKTNSKYRRCIKFSILWWLFNYKRYRVWSSKWFYKWIWNKRYRYFFTKFWNIWNNILGWYSFSNSKCYSGLYILLFCFTNVYALDRNYCYCYWCIINYLSTYLFYIWLGLKFILNIYKCKKIIKYNNLGYFIKIAIFSNSILNVIIN